MNQENIKLENRKYNENVKMMGNGKWEMMIIIIIIIIIIMTIIIIKAFNLFLLRYYGQ